MRVVGRDRPLHDAPGKVTGQTVYAGDMTFPRMAHVCLVHSTLAHGRILSIDTAAAEAIEGVYGVFHCFNTTKKKYNRYRSQFSQGLPDEERAFNQHIRFYGERVAAVAAKDLETAHRAAHLIKVSYEPLPYAISIEEALTGKNLLPGEEAIKDTFKAENGSFVESKETLISIETQTELPRLHHVAMEPHVCVADYDSAQDYLTVYSPNQTVFGIRTMMSEYLEMPTHRIRVIKTTMGGSFGCKQEWFTEPVAALLAKLLRRPVKLVYTRAEAMTCSVVRAAMRASLRSQFTADGQMCSLDVDLLADSGAYIGNSRDYVRALYGKFFRCYRMPHITYRARIVSANTPVSGAYRGWSAPEEATMLEHNLNVAAHRLKIDPIDLRLKNILLPGDCDAKTGFAVEKIRIREALERGREIFCWEDKKREDAAFNAASPRYRRGVGVGCGGHVSSYFPRYNDFGTASLRLNEDGTLQALVTLHDHGCGTVTMIRMLLAETMEMDEQDIFVPEGDTAWTPYDYGCFSSRTTFMLGRTVCDAAQELKEKMLSSTSEIYGVAREQLYCEESCVRNREDAQFSLSYRKLAQQTMLRLRQPLSAEVSFHNTTSPAVTAAHFAHVEVDMFTGFTKILDYLAVQDVGRAINPISCITQTQSAVQMGCGAALREKLTIQPNGHCTDSLSKYHVFLATDLPNIQVELLTDGESSEGPYGAKSIGEISYVPAAAAVCGAVNCALGSELGTLPLDPDRILKYLSEVKQA